MRFEWDLSKDRANRKKHGIGFDAAERVFRDPFATSVFDRYVDGEARWQTIGVAELGKILVVVHVYRGEGDEAIRIISARKADKHEQRAYTEGD